jgi:beta-glucanase (GH16 family)
MTLVVRPGVNDAIEGGSRYPLGITKAIASLAVLILLAGCATAGRTSSAPVPTPALAQARVAATTAGPATTSGATVAAAAAAAAAACSPLLSLLHACGTTTTGAPVTTTAPTTTSAVPPATTSAPTTTSAPAGSCGGGGPPIAPPGGAWACTFDDEFGEPSLDLSKWQPQLTATSDYTNGSAPNQVCYVDDPANISVSGGYLDLSITRAATPFTCQGIDGIGFSTRFYGGDVSTYQRFSQTYGYFEVDAALPASTIQGLQETFWLYPESQGVASQGGYGPWPDSGEVDFEESYSVYPNTDYPVVHYPGDTSDPAWGHTCPIPQADVLTRYGVEWTPTTLTIFINGVECEAEQWAPHVTSPDKGSDPFNKPFFVVLTAALGSDPLLGNDADAVTSATQIPATTRVKYVRAWQY